MLIALAAPGPRAAPDERRQPRHATRHARPPTACICSRRRSGPGALAPHQIVVDTGRAGGRARPRPSPPSARLVARAARATRASSPRRSRRRRSAPPAVARQADLLDPAAQVLQIRAAGHTDAGTEDGAERSCTRSATRYIPAAGFPRSDRVLPDRRARPSAWTSSTRPTAPSPGSCAAVLVITYFVLLRAFRSVVLPLKAVLMNLLSVSAAYGVLVLVFQHGIGQLDRLPQLAADRSVDPDLPVRDDLRALDGLRGVPALAHARGVGPHATTTSTRSPTGSSTPGASSPPRRSS